LQIEKNQSDKRLLYPYVTFGVSNLKTSSRHAQRKLGTVTEIKQEDMQKITGLYANTLGDKLEQSKNKMNILIAGFFSQFAENMPKWLLVQEYSKSFEDFQKLAQIMKKERTNMAADSEAEEMVFGSGGPGTAAATVPCKLSAAIAEPKSLDFKSRGDILLGSGRTKVAMET
jgi:hypothetical protein